MRNVVKEMRYIALACDYDGTLADQGRVKPDTLAALERLVASGRKLFLVSGRQLDDLLQVFPKAIMAEAVVAENGAILFRPHTNKKTMLGKAPPGKFIEALRARGVDPSAGEVIVATRHPNEETVLQTIRDLGLDLQVIFNKGAVMVLPSGINKGTGLAAAAEDTGLSVHNIIGIGDAENDYSFLSLCECSVAVANALPEVKEQVDLVTQASHGEGVTEIIDRLVSDDLAEAETVLSRHHILLGQNEQGQDINIRPYGINVLLVGPSAAGTSNLASGFIERAGEKKYQYCIIDPEGDYNTSSGVVLGSKQFVPGVDEIIHLLKNPDNDVIVYLLGVPVEDRPAFFNRLLSELQELRLRTGHPHWVLINESHLLIPPGYSSYFTSLPEQARGFFFITLDLALITAGVLTAIDDVIVMGRSCRKSLRYFAAAVGISPPNMKKISLGQDSALVWDWKNRDLSRLALAPGDARHKL